MEPRPEGREYDRRALLRRAAAAGAVAWTAPVIISSAPVSAGVFTAKCAPGTITASAGFVRTACRSNNSDIRITINFAGPCPCGGVSLWCAQKNSPGSVVATGTSTLVFTVTVPIFSTITIAGKVGLGCTDRDGDRQFAVYDWSMTARDNGQACSTVVNSISAVTLSGRTVTNSATCPSLAALTVAPLIESSVAGDAVRPPG